MNQRHASNGPNWMRRQYRPAFFLLLAFAFLMVSCGGGGDAEEEALLEPFSTAVLTCSQECASRGQCGSLDDERKAVLGNSVMPETVAHDRVFADGTAVTINRVAMATLEAADTAEQSQLPFYFVATTDPGRSGWIPGWCIMAAPAAE